LLYFFPFGFVKTGRLAFFTCIVDVQLRDKFEEMHVFPKPLSEEFMQSVREWEQSPSEIDENSLALAEMHANSEPDVELEVTLLLMGYMHLVCSARMRTVTLRMRFST
jgi:hypothetical protein